MDAYVFVTHNPLLANCADLSSVEWRKRTDPIWTTDYLLPEVLLEAIDRELELLEYSKMIDEDSTTVVSEFRNVPPAADGTIYTEVALNTAKTLWDVGLTPSVLYKRDAETGAETPTQRSVDIVKAFQFIVFMCGPPKHVVERSGGDGNVAAAVAEPMPVDEAVDEDNMQELKMEDEVDYDPDDIDMGSRAGDVDLSGPLENLDEVAEINAANPIIHPKDVWRPGETVQTRMHAMDCAQPRQDCDSGMLMSYYTRSFDDFATARESETVPYEPMLSYDLTARKLRQNRDMAHISNCRGAKANVLSYEPLCWKTVRCYNGRVNHDADPWVPDENNMRLDVPNHKIDMSKPLRDQRCRCCLWCTTTNFPQPLRNHGQEYHYDLHWSVELLRR